MFDIAYNHSDFVIINKYPGVSVHKDDGDTMLLQEVENRLELDKLYLVHRLDKMTSGLLILAKSATAARELSQLFAERQIEKFYLAIGNKKPKKKQGLISGDMERSRRSSWKLVQTKANPAITQFVSVAGQDGQRVFLCKPHTGKTHQIRVALNSIGSSILGDPIYGGNVKSDRGYLHAYALRFSYHNEFISILCPPQQQADVGIEWESQAVQLAIESWQAPWDLSWPVVKQSNRT